MNQTIVTLIGVGGFLLLLTAFIANLLKKMHVNSIAYNALNCGDGFTWGVFAILSKSHILFFLLNMIWGGAALINLIQGIRKIGADV